MALPLVGCGTGSMLSGGNFTSVDETYDAQYQLIDTDNDKRISYADTRAWLTRTIADNDANKDGKLSDTEVPAVLFTPKSDAKSFITSYDRDRDEKVSAEELGVHVNVLFQRDSDADGQLTHDESRHVPKRQSETPASTATPGGSAPGGPGMPK